MHACIRMLCHSLQNQQALHKNRMPGWVVGSENVDYGYIDLKARREYFTSLIDYFSVSVSKTDSCTLSCLHRCDQLVTCIV